MKMVDVKVFAARTEEGSKVGSMVPSEINEKVIKRLVLNDSQIYLTDQGKAILEEWGKKLWV
jgi:hypothetical protein